MRWLGNLKPNFSFESISIGTFASFLICYIIGLILAPFLPPQIISVASLSRKLPAVQSAFENLMNANAEVSADRLLYTSAIFSIVATVSVVLMLFCGIGSRIKVARFAQTIEVFWVLIFCNVVLVAFIIFPQISKEPSGLWGLIHRTDAGYLFFAGEFQFSLYLCFMAARFFSQKSKTFTELE